MVDCLAMAAHAIKPTPADGSGRHACATCRNWHPLSVRWGRCRSSHVSCRIGPEPPLVTRATFGCRFWSQSAVIDLAAAEADGDDL